MRCTIAFALVQLAFHCRLLYFALELPAALVASEPHRYCRPSVTTRHDTTRHEYSRHDTGKGTTRGGRVPRTGSGLVKPPNTNKYSCRSARGRDPIRDECAACCSCHCCLPVVTGGSGWSCSSSMSRSMSGAAAAGRSRAIRRRIRMEESREWRLQRCSRTVTIALLR